MTISPRDLERIAQLAPGMLGYWDRQLICRFANQAYLLFFGREPEALIGRHASVVLGKLFELNRPYMEGALRGETQHFEREIPDPSGGPSRFTEARYVPDVGLDGVVCGFVAMVTDITERHALEVELRARKQLMRLSLENLPRSATFLVDASLRYLMAQGPLFKEFTQQEPHALIGQRMEDYVSPANRELFVEGVRRALNGESVQVSVLRGGRSFDCTFQPVGPSKQVLGFVHEDTEHLARLMRVQNQELHHRVKNNLQMVSSLLRLQARVAPAAAEALKSSQARIEGIALLHEQLYVTASVDSVELEAYLPRVIAALAANASGAVRFDVSCAPALVSLEIAVVCGLLVNELVTNALKHAKASEIGVTLEVIEGGRLQLRVVDDGAQAISPEALTRRDGMGVGLVRDLTRQLRGECSFDTSRGLNVTITFPGGVG